MIGRLSDQAQGILTAVKRRQRPSGAPQAPSRPEPAERPQERPQARETPPQAPQEPPKPIRTKKALTDRFTTRLDERLAENERKQRIVARENAKARKRRTHLIIRLGGILSNEGVLGYDEGVWNDEGNRQRLLDMLKAHAAELRAWASDAGVRLPSAESAGELREQVRDLPQEPQIQEQPGYGYQPGFQQPQQWQQQPWN